MCFPNPFDAIRWLDEHVDYQGPCHMRRDGAVWLGDVGAAPGKPCDWGEVTILDLEEYCGERANV